MRSILQVFAAAAVLGTCLSAWAEYKTEVKVMGLDKSHQYLVGYKITLVGRDGQTDRLMYEPQMLVNAGKEGRLEVLDQKSGDGVIGTALIKETETGVVAVTKVVVRAEGKETLNNTQSVEVIKERPSQKPAPKTRVAPSEGRGD